MKWIALSNGEVYATDERVGGVFIRKEWGFHQVIPKLNTPLFNNPGEFRRYLLIRFDIGDGRIGEEGGWNL